MHHITLYVIDKHIVRCLEPFLPLSDHVANQSNSAIFLSVRFETKRTQSPNIGAHVLFVSKRSDQNWRSDYDLQRLIYEATNIETRVNFSNFQGLIFWVISLHYITLYVIDIHNVRCLEPFLPPYDHFKNRRFWVRNWQY